MFTEVPRPRFTYNFVFPIAFISVNYFLENNWRLPEAVDVWRLAARSTRSAYPLSKESGSLRATFFPALFFPDNFVAQFYAFIADVDTRTSNKVVNL